MSSPFIGCATGSTPRSVSSLLPAMQLSTCSWVPRDGNRSASTCTDSGVTNRSGCSYVWGLSGSALWCSGWNSGAATRRSLPGSWWNGLRVAFPLSYTGTGLGLQAYSSSSPESPESCSKVSDLWCRLFLWCCLCFCGFRVRLSSPLCSMGRSFTGKRRLRCKTRRVRSPVSAWIRYTGPTPILSTTRWTLFSQ